MVVVYRYRTCCKRDVDGTIGKTAMKGETVGIHLAQVAYLIKVS
jgi:hypothetical protein